jgi:DNA-binding NtrC family response regulator
MMPVFQGTPPQILVVEDDRVVSQVFRLTLERQGCRVLLASGGKEAVRLMHANSKGIDLLVSDVLLGRRGCSDFVPYFQERFPSTPILFVSGFPLHHALSCGLLDEKLMEERSTSFLQKPFMPEDLARAVRQAMNYGHLATVGAPIA